MKIVIDTNVIASARFFGGKPRKLIRLLMDGRYDAYVSASIIEEYNETDVQLKEDYPDKPVSFSLPPAVLNYRQARKCFSPICCSRKFIEIYVEISPGFCYNIGVSLCSRAGVKNPRWQADT